MQVFHHRPLALACCCFALCALLLQFLPSLIQLILIGVLLLLVLCSIVFYCKQRNKNEKPLLCLLISIALLLSTVSSYCFFHVRYERYRDMIDTSCTIEGIVLERRVGKPYESVLLVQVNSLNGARCRTDMYVKFPYASALQAGDGFRLTGTAVAFQKEHGYNEEQYALADGVLLCVACEDSSQCAVFEAKPSLRVMLSDWNDGAAFYLEEAIGGEAGKLSSALLLGARERLSDQTVLRFQRAGVSHLLALSGLHVSILIGFFEFVLKKLKVHKAVRTAVVFISAFAYLFFTGASPSITRAVLMLGVLSLGFYLRVPYDSFTALTAILSLLLLMMPYAVKDLGLWMSFLAAGSIIIFLPMIEEVRQEYQKTSKLPPWLFSLLFGFVSAVFIGIVANLGLLLLQAVTFGEASLASVPATLLMSIPVSSFLVLSPVTLLLPFISPVTAFLGDVILGIARCASELDFVLLPLGDAVSKCCLLLLTASLIWIAVKKHRRILVSFAMPLALAAVTVLASFAVSYVPDRGVCVTVVHESGGEVLLFTHRTQSVMIDFSDGTATGGAIAVEYAYEQRCTVLDDLFLSHYHNRDTYFISSMASRIHIKRLHLPIPQNSTEQAIATQLQAKAESFGIEVVYGIGTHAISQLEITRFERAEFHNTRHTALLFEAAINGHELIYANGSVLDSALFDVTIDEVQDAELFVLGDTGFSTSSSSKFPFFALSNVERILLTEEKLSAMLQPDFPKSNYSIMDEVTVLFWK